MFLRFSKFSNNCLEFSDRIQGLSFSELVVSQLNFEISTSLHFQDFSCGPYIGSNTPAGQGYALLQLSCFNTPTSRVSPSLISGTQGMSPSFLETPISWLIESSSILGPCSPLWAPQQPASESFGLSGLWYWWMC